MPDLKSSDFYPKRQWFLDEWRTTVLPLRDHALAAEKYAVDFSLLTIRTTALLNGGALIALPAFGAFFKVSLMTATGDLFWAGVFFSTGLLLSWVAMAAGYYTNHCHAEELFAARDIAANSAHIAFEGALGPSTEPTHDNRKEYIERMNTQRKWHIRWVVAATVASLMSLGFFIAGAYFGGTAFVAEFHVGST